jgi:hypothetical protein
VGKIHGVGFWWVTDVGAHGVGAVVRNSVGNTTILFLGKNYQAQRIIMTVIVVAVTQHLVRRPFVGVDVRRIVAKDGEQAI